MDFNIRKYIFFREGLGLYVFIILDTFSTFSIKAIGNPTESQKL